MPTFTLSAALGGRGSAPGSDHSCLRATFAGGLVSSDALLCLRGAAAGLGATALLRGPAADALAALQAACPALRRGEGAAPDAERSLAALLEAADDAQPLASHPTRAPLLLGGQPVAGAFLLFGVSFDGHDVGAVLAAAEDGEDAAAPAGALLLSQARIARPRALLSHI